MLDEAHERSINTDILLGLIQRVMKARPSLRVIVTSATLQTAKFASYFGNCPILTIPGRVYPVDIFHSRARVKASNRRSLVDAVVRLVMRIHMEEEDGHVLVFLTGQEEIEQACAALRSQFEEEWEGDRADADELGDMEVLPLYGALPSERQAAVFREVAPGCRKVVVSTNIAETSVTVNGVRFVVDPGYVKQRQFSARSSMDALEVVTISRSAAEQRAGRAGRTAPGKCFRLYPTHTLETMEAETRPEIQRSNLANVVLHLKVLGVTDVLGFNFLDSPAPDALRAALRGLYGLEALDEDGGVRALGKAMAGFPLDPALARSLIESASLGCSEEVVSIAAMLSTESVFLPRPRMRKDRGGQLVPQRYGAGAGAQEIARRRAQERRVAQEREEGQASGGVNDEDVAHYEATLRALRHPSGDHMTLLRVYEQWTAGGRRDQWCQEHFVHGRAMRFASNAREQLVDLLRGAHLAMASCRGRSKPVRKAFAAGYFANCAVRSANGAYKTLADPRDPIITQIHPSSALALAGQSASSGAREKDGDDDEEDGAGGIPDCVIFHELVRTSRAFMRGVTEVDERWIRKRLPRLLEADLGRLSGRGAGGDTQTAVERDGAPSAGADSGEADTSGGDAAGAAPQAGNGAAAREDSEGLSGVGAIDVAREAARLASAGGPSASDVDAARRRAMERRRKR